MPMDGKRETSVAVAVNKDKTSLHALQWAVDHIVGRDQNLKILHVKDSVSTSVHPPGANDEMSTDSDKHIPDVFLPFLCFCKRKQVQGEAVMLEDSDVAKAIVEYVFRYRVEVLLLGAGSRTGLSRLFRASDIPGSILKLAPAFCTVYVISKRRICGMRKAKLLVSDISSHGGAMRAHRHSSFEEASSAESVRWYDELSAADMDFQFDGSIRPSTDNPFFARPSTDNPFFAFHDNLGFEQTHNSTGLPTSENTDQRPSSADEFSSPPKFKSSLLNTEDKDDEIKRLRIELCQTMEMYHAACKEALAAKDKVTELEQWKMKEERRLRGSCPTEETTTRTVETVKQKVKRTTGDAAAEADEARRKATQKLVGREMQCRVKKMTRRDRKAEEENVIIDAFGQTHKEIEYRCLLHIVVVLSLFYFYFSIS